MTGGAVEEKPGLVDRVKAAVLTARRRSPFFDHVMRMLQHYGEVQGNVLAGAVTFFGFLSFFPILALTFAVLGYVLAIYSDPEIEKSVIDAIESIFPNMVGAAGSGAPIEVSVFKESKAAAGIVGLVGLLYSGLGWLSGLRAALQAMFVVPKGEKRNFFLGKVVDLIALGLIGLTLVVSVGLTGVVQGMARQLLELVQLDEVGAGGMEVAVHAVGVVLGLLASTTLFLAIFKILPKPSLPGGALLRGAFLAAVGFEVLKQLASFLIRQVTDNPAFALLGISLVLLVWINYFSRVTLYGAAWAVTYPQSRELMAARGVPIAGGGPGDEEAAEEAARAQADEAGLRAEREAEHVRQTRQSFATGAAVGALLGAMISAIRRARR